MTKVIKTKDEKQPRVCQGDIIRDIEYIEYAIEKDGFIEVSKIQFPLIIVLTQECDLEQDYKFRTSDPPKQTQDKQLISTLVAPLYNLEHFYDGIHLEMLELKMEPFEKRPKKSKNILFKDNEIPRYHYINFPENIPIVESVIDFKHYFSVNTKYIEKLKETNFICQVSELFREDISHRFSSFLSRIGLPD